MSVSAETDALLLLFRYKPSETGSTSSEVFSFSASVHSPSVSFRGLPKIKEIQTTTVRVMGYPFTLYIKRMKTSGFNKTVITEAAT